MCNAGLIPERTCDPRRAFHLWSSDGAVILTTHRTGAAGMLTGVRDIFGPRLFVHQSPTTVPARLVLHIDGYLEFGDCYPDLVFVLCQRPATTGGELFLVDGQRLLHAIAGDPTKRALSRFLWDVTLEQGRSRWGLLGRNRQAGLQPATGGLADLRWAPHRAPSSTPTPPRRCRTSA